jgi:hypothetical protein
MLIEALLGRPVRHTHIDAWLAYSVVLISTFESSISQNGIFQSDHIYVVIATHDCFLSQKLVNLLGITQAEHLLAVSEGQAFTGAAFEEDVVRQHHGGAAVLLEDGEDVLVPQPRDELQCRCGSHLLVLAQKSSPSMVSDFSDKPAQLRSAVGCPHEFVN